MANIYEGSVKKQSLLTDIPAYKPETPDTGFTENVKSSFAEVSTNRVTDAGFVKQSVDDDAFNKQYDIAKTQALDIAVPNTLKDIVNSVANPSALAQDWKAKTDRIKELQTEFPDLGLKTYDEIRKEIDDTHANIERDYQKTTATQTVSGLVGSIVGALGGFFTDPVNIVATALPLGLGFGAKASSAIGGVSKIAAAEGAVNAGLQGLAEPNTIKNKALIGIATTPTEVAADIGVAAGFGAVGGGIAGSVSRLFNPVTKQALESADRLLKMHAEGSPVPEESVIGAKALQDTHELISDAPPEISQVKHAELTAKAVQDTYMGRPVDVDTPVHSPSSAITDPLIPVSDPISDSSLAQVQKQTIADMTAQTETKDFVVPFDEIDDSGVRTTGTASLKDILVETRKDQKAFDLLNKCLITGDISNVTD